MAKPEPLRYAVIEITNRCNLRCAHCASSSGLPRENELLLEEIQSLLADIRALGGETITLLGGEALLREDWIDIAQEIGRLGMRLILISNGLLFTRDTFATLRDLRPHLIGISIDGATRETYQAERGCDGFETCLRVLRQLCDDGHSNVNAITTFTRRNLQQFDAFADLFANTGITWQVQIANGGGKRFERDSFISRKQYAWLTERMREVYVRRLGEVRLRHMDDFGYFPLDPKLRFLHETWHGCIAGRELIGVRSNGDVLGCLSLADEFVEANLRQVPLRELWGSGQFFTRLRRKEESLKGECAICPYAAQCRAGCSAIAWSATGSLGCNTHCLRSLESEAILNAINA